MLITNENCRWCIQKWCQNDYYLYMSIVVDMNELTYNSIAETNRSNVMWYSLSNKRLILPSSAALYNLTRMQAMSNIDNSRLLRPHRGLRFSWIGKSILGPPLMGQIGDNIINLSISTIANGTIFIYSWREGSVSMWRSMLRRAAASLGSWVQAPVQHRIEQILFLEVLLRIA